MNLFPEQLLSFFGLHLPFGEALANHAPNRFLRPVCRALSFPTDQFHQRRCPFCFPLVTVPSQVSEFLHENMHVTRRCVSVRMFVFDLLPSGCVAFNASNGGCPACRSGRSSLLNSLATIRDLICMGFPQIALFVSIHFGATGVTWYCATASRSSTISYTPRSRTYFDSCSRAWRTSCHGDSLPVTSWVFFSSLCQCRVFLTIASCEGLDGRLSQLLFVLIFLLLVSFGLFRFSNFSNTSNCDSIHHDALQILTFANSSEFSNFYSTCCDVLHLVTLDLFWYASVVCDHSVFKLASFQIAESLFNTRTTTLRSLI